MHVPPVARARWAALVVLTPVVVCGVTPTDQTARAQQPGRSTVAPAHVSRKLGGAIDQYLKEVEAADKAKAAAADKLVATYEATIKRTMRSGELRLVEELQEELKQVKAELDRSSRPNLNTFREALLGRTWYVYWDSKRTMEVPCEFKADGSMGFGNPVKTRDWPKTWSIEVRPVVVMAGNVLLALPNGELRGFFLGTGQPVGAFPVHGVNNVR